MNDDRAALPYDGMTAIEAEAAGETAEERMQRLSVMLPLGYATPEERPGAWARYTPIATARDAIREARSEGPGLDALRIAATNLRDALLEGTSDWPDAMDALTAALAAQENPEASRYSVARSEGPGLDALRAAVLGLTKASRLKRKALHPESSYDPLLRESVVLALIDRFAAVGHRPLTVDRMAAAMNDAQILASEIRLGRDLAVPAARIVEALGRNAGDAA